MSTILDRIKAYKLEDVAARKAARPLADLEDAARAAPAPRGFAKALRQAAAAGYGLIAEIKKASPSKGLIRPDFDPPALARAYEAGGATCLSVLTDGPSFQGRTNIWCRHMMRRTCPASARTSSMTPIRSSRRALKADCILLIMASLDDVQAAELEQVALDLGMDVLIEVHDRAELDRAAKLKSPLLGINNRNLHTFDVTLDTTRDLARRAPEDRLIVSESGLFTPADLADMAQYGARCFLIGESLMRQADVTAATRAILAQPLTAQGGVRCRASRISTQPAMPIWSMFPTSP
ncbi:indole-3-glycerol phosphate synthase TrpC [Gemmobacter lanyuensis]